MDYDIWKQECDTWAPDCMCRDCEFKEQVLDDASHYFEGVVKQLYNTESLDIKTLVHCLGELGHLLKVKIPRTIQIERKTQEIDWLQDWKIKNNQFLRKLV